MADSARERRERAEYEKWERIAALSPSLALIVFIHGIRNCDVYDGAVVVYYEELDIKRL